MRLYVLALLLLCAIPSSASSVAITTKTLPNGTVGTVYSAAVYAAGGCTPYTWKITGALPVGVAYAVSGSTTSILLKGTPTIAATYTFAVGVTGCGKHVNTVSYSVVIQAGANHTVGLSWNASTSTNVAGYNVYRKTGGAWGKINVSLVGGTVYTDSTVANATTYNYATTAVDISGRESALSNIVVALIP